LLLDDFSIVSRRICCGEIWVAHMNCDEAAPNRDGLGLKAKTPPGDPSGVSLFQEAGSLLLLPGRLLGFRLASGFSDFRRLLLRSHSINLPRTLG
jgi:hypothetical protein